MRGKHDGLAFPILLHSRRSIVESFQRSAIRVDTAVGILRKPTLESLNSFDRFFADISVYLQRCRREYLVKNLLNSSRIWLAILAASPYGTVDRYAH